MNNDLDISFSWACKKAYLNNIRPFDVEITDREVYKQLYSIAGKYALPDFIGYLMEYQYYINLWASIFILEKFRPEKEVKLIGLNDDKSIVEECIETSERHTSQFNTIQTDNYLKWMLNIKIRYGMI